MFFGHREALTEDGEEDEELAKKAQVEQVELRRSAGAVGGWASVEVQAGNQSNAKIEGFRVDVSNHFRNEQLLTRGLKALANLLKAYLREAEKESAQKFTDADADYHREAGSQ